LRSQEIKSIIDKAGEIYGLWFQACLAIAWLFGKRISEILTLKREDCSFDSEYIHIRFLVLKKSRRKKTGQKISKDEYERKNRFLKRISVKNPYAHYIIDHLDQVETGWLFTIEGRRVSRFQLHRRLKKCDPNAWFHLFRHSLATVMAERGATETELMSWFDWTAPKVAHGYVVRGPKLTERLSNRTW